MIGIVHNLLGTSECRFSMVDIAFFQRGIVLLDIGTCSGACNSLTVGSLYSFCYRTQLSLVAEVALLCNTDTAISAIALRRGLQRLTELISVSTIGKMGEEEEEEATVDLMRRVLKVT